MVDRGSWSLGIPWDNKIQPNLDQPVRGIINVGRSIIFFLAIVVQYINVILCSNTTRKENNSTLITNIHLRGCKQHNILICTLIWYCHFMLPIGPWICTCGFALLVNMCMHILPNANAMSLDLFGFILYLYTLRIPLAKPTWRWNIPPV